MDTQDRLIDAMHGRAGEIYIYNGEPTLLLHDCMRYCSYRQCTGNRKKFKIAAVLAVVKPLCCPIWCKPGEAKCILTQEGQ
jgi:hypothetical protein